MSNATANRTVVDKLCLQANDYYIKPSNAELNPICHLLALLEAHHIFHISGLRVKKRFVFISTNVTLANLWAKIHQDCFPS